MFTILLMAEYVYGSTSYKVVNDRLFVYFYILWVGDWLQGNVDKHVSVEI